MVQPYLVVPQTQSHAASAMWAAKSETSALQCKGEKGAATKQIYHSQSAQLLGIMCRRLGGKKS